jgi:hypothetical protein
MAGKRRYRTEHQNQGVARLEQVRQRLGWSAHRMAQALEVSFRTYQKWLYTGQHPRHLGAIIQRAEALCVTRRANCWEVLECGHGPGAAPLCEGEGCPAVTDGSANGINGGVNGGRLCWAIAGTMCGNGVRGAHATKLLSCLGCPFFTQVWHEEGLASFKLLKPGQTYTQP